MEEVNPEFVINAKHICIHREKVRGCGLQEETTVQIWTVCVYGYGGALWSGVTEVETLGMQRGQHKKENDSQLAEGPKATLSSSSHLQQWAAAG